MKTYLINLSRATERLRKTDAHLRTVGIMYERVDAVDGQTLTPVQRRTYCNTLRFFILHARRPQPTEIGCALSHQAVYSRMAQNGIPLALILEDDARLDPERLADSLLRIKADNHPDTPQAWLLCKGHAPTPDVKSPALIPTTPFASCAEAYVINLAGAKLLRRLNGRIQTLADNWGRWTACGLRVKWAVPFACGLTDLPSQIDWDVPRRARWRWYRALWRLRHTIGRHLDRLLYRLIGR